MKHARGMLIRFIDLGLLLLMAFLAVADLDDTFQVALPGMKPGASGGGSVYQIRFAAGARYVVTRSPEGTPVCTAGSLEALAACVRGHGLARYVLVPGGAAAVQHLVNVLDVCEAEGLSCALGRSPIPAHED